MAVGLHPDTGVGAARPRRGAAAASGVLARRARSTSASGGSSSGSGARRPTTAGPGCSRARCHRGRRATLDGGPAGLEGVGTVDLRSGPRARRGRRDRAGQRRRQPAAGDQRRHQDLRPAEGPARGAAGHRGRAGCSGFAEATDRKLAGAKGAGAAGGLGFALMLLGGTRELGCRGWWPRRSASPEPWPAPTSSSPARGPSTSPRARARCPTAWREVATEHLVPCIALAGQVLIGSREMRALGVESAYSMVDLVGEERCDAGAGRGPGRRWPSATARTWSR